MDGKLTHGECKMEKGADMNEKLNELKSQMMMMMLEEMSLEDRLATRPSLRAVRDWFIANGEGQTQKITKAVGFKRDRVKRAIDDLIALGEVRVLPYNGSIKYQWIKD